MKKCPNCSYKDHEVELMTFEEFMDLTIKRISNKQMKEYGYGVQEKNNQRSSKARK